MVVGMAYVPMQVWGNITEPAEAICRGTQFPDLDKPFFGEDIWA
ncbi:MAG: spore coat associated protein CotJA [Oscillospiraceae bacterium]|nr:spore coat associated protein CotJA [Oscillospiraceae bacterium]